MNGRQSLKEIVQKSMYYPWTCNWIIGHSKLTGNLSASNGEVLYSGGNTLVGPNGGGSMQANPWDPGAYNAYELVQLDLVLPDSTNDCYEFLLVDAYGDGITTNGHVRITERQSGKEVALRDFSEIVFTTEEIIIL